ncbi:predicted protein [Histoplasma capsulatum var. duboisii H88]|uniref:Predicted protein n=1 Tax=Ajellomyces capsulatus (strain H88) TaxID=544711 RepID=F0UCA8_AJEC8|nr:predicted protein [Histoplasma capsulatum var. duboisii H88]
MLRVAFILGFDSRRKKKDPSEQDQVGSREKTTLSFNFHVDLFKNSLLCTPQTDRSTPAVASGIIGSIPVVVVAAIVEHSTYLPGSSETLDKSRTHANASTSQLQLADLNPNIRPYDTNLPFSTVTGLKLPGKAALNYLFIFIVILSCRSAW